MDTSIVTPNNSKVLMIKLRRETSHVSYSTDNRSNKNESKRKSLSSFNSWKVYLSTLSVQ